MDPPKQEEEFVVEASCGHMVEPSFRLKPDSSGPRRISGLIASFNSSSVTIFSSRRTLRTRSFRATAFLKTSAARSYPIFGVSAVTTDGDSSR